MYSSTRSFARVALMACALAGAACVAAVANPLKAAWRFVSCHFQEACAMATTPDTLKSTKPTLLVKAGAFAAALVKRERPKLSPTWRMCPST